MNNKIDLTERQLKEIAFALVYERDFGHGTDGHHRLIIIAKLAGIAGLEVASIDDTLYGLDGNKYIEAVQ